MLDVHGDVVEVDRHRVKRSAVNDVLAYFLLAWMLSTASVLPWVVLGRDVVRGVGWPTHLPSLVAPLIAAVGVTFWTRGRSGVQELLTHVKRWRFGAWWWLATLSPLAYLIAVFAGMWSFGIAIPAKDGFAQFSGISAGLGILSVGLVVILVNGFGEETGWRGFALERLQRRMTPLRATLVVAAGWAAWHIPFFFVLDTYKDFSPAMLAVFVLGIGCGALVCTWLYNGTGGSILAVAVWHGLYNMTGATGAAAAGSGTLASATWTFVVLHAAVLLVVDRRRKRAGGASIFAPPSHALSREGAFV